MRRNLLPKRSMLLRTRAREGRQSSYERARALCGTLRPRPGAFLAGARTTEGVGLGSISRSARGGPRRAYLGRKQGSRRKRFPLHIPSACEYGDARWGQSVSPTLPQGPRVSRAATLLRGRSERAPPLRKTELSACATACESRPYGVVSAGGRAARGHDAHRHRGEVLLLRRFASNTRSEIWQGGRSWR